MRIVTLKKETSLLALASCSGTTEAELMEINGLERRSSLPRGMSLILPSKDEKPKKLALLYPFQRNQEERLPNNRRCNHQELF